jgi:hypothetical protein
MKPVGLTRAEEALQEKKEAHVRQAAPAGVLRCRISVPPNGDNCVSAATDFVVWKGDGSERTPACAECALDIQRRCPGAVIRVERIKTDTTVDTR